MSYTADNVPSSVPKQHAAQWAAIWNSKYEHEINAGKPHDEAESAAFAAASGHIKNLTETNPPDSGGLVQLSAADTRIAWNDPTVDYQELPDAVRDGDCNIVQHPGGFSGDGGCCNKWARIPQPKKFSCSTCVHFAILKPSDKTQLQDTVSSSMPSDLTINISGNVSPEQLRAMFGDNKQVLSVPKQTLTADEFADLDLDDTGMPMEMADKEPYGDVEYADPGYQSDKKKRYPLDSEKHIRAANSYIGQKRNAGQYTSEQLAHIKSKIVAAWKSKIDPDGPPSAEKASDTTGHDGRFVWLLSDLQPINLNGKQMFELPVSIVGTFHKDGRKFSITSGDHDAMIQNLRGRGNGQVVVDYEHASEQPEVAQGGPVPAAGWIHDLRKKQITDRKGNAVEALAALIEWTPTAQNMLQEGAYRFFSPAIDWSKADKKTGDPLGAYLTSGALTNHPFLEDLPAICLSDMMLSAGAQAVHTDGAVGSISVDFDNSADPAQMSEKKAAKMKLKKLKKIADGPDAGKFGVYHDGQMLRAIKSQKLNDQMETMTDAELDEMLHDMLDDMDNASDHDDCAGNPQIDTRVADMPQTPLSEKTSTVGEVQDTGRKTESAIALPNSTEGDTTKMSETTNTPAAETKPVSVLLTDCVAEDGTLNLDQLVDLATSGKVPVNESTRAIKLRDELDKAISVGQILPKHRKQFMKMALTDEAGFKEFIATSSPVVDLSTRGVGSATPTTGTAGSSNAENQFMQMSRQRLTEARAQGRKGPDGKEFTFEHAFGEVSRENPALYQEYRKATVNLTDRPDARRVSF